MIESGETGKVLDSAERGKYISAPDIRTATILRLAPYTIYGAYGLGLNDSKQLLDDDSIREISLTKELPVFVGKEVTRVKCSTKLTLVHTLQEACRPFGIAKPT